MGGAWWVASSDFGSCSGARVLWAAVTAVPGAEAVIMVREQFIAEAAACPGLIAVSELRAELPAVPRAGPVIMGGRVSVLR